MKQKYQNTIGFIALVILLSLMPLILLAQGPTQQIQFSSLEISKSIEHAVLQEIAQANSNNSFTKVWKLQNQENCCLLKEVTCNADGLITTLDLSELKLTVLPASIQSLTKLERLHLHGNDLVQLPMTLVNLDKLSELTLFDNDIESLNPELRELCGTIVRNGLAGNPIGRYMTWEEFCRGI